MQAVRVKSRLVEPGQTLQFQWQIKGLAMSQYQLAQLNIATMKESKESPLMGDFVANLERIYAIAERSPGFVWRLKDEEEEAAGIRLFGESILINMSVWENIEALRSFVFKSAHLEVLRRRWEWFEKMTEAYTVLWWTPAGQRPTVLEAKERLMYLRQYGSTTYAFTFRDVFAVPGA
jgi:hypothetical protein